MYYPPCYHTSRTRNTPRSTTMQVTHVLRCERDELWARCERSKSELEDMVRGTRVLGVRFLGFSGTSCGAK